MYPMRQSSSAPHASPSPPVPPLPPSPTTTHWCVELHLSPSDALQLASERQPSLQISAVVSQYCVAGQSLCWAHAIVFDGAQNPSPPHTGVLPLQVTPPLVQVGSSQRPADVAHLVKGAAVHCPSVVQVAARTHRCVVRLQDRLAASQSDWRWHVGADAQRAGLCVVSQ